MGYNIGPADKMRYPWVQQAADLLGQMFGIKTIGGWRPNDPYPDHPGGYALDLMTFNGQPLADYAAKNAAALNVDYIIWNRKSWNAKRGTWAPYTGSNPHTDHVHITFKKTPPGNGLSLTGLTNGAQNLGATAMGWTFDLDKATKQAEGTALILIGATLGLSLIGLGILNAVKPTVAKHLGG